MGLVLKNDSKGRKVLKGLQKPSAKARVNETIPDGYEAIERLTKRVEALEKLYRQTNNLLLAYVDQVEKLKRGG
jgi:hypothetical protein